jgi:hypothetical protein
MRRPILAATAVAALAIGPAGCGRPPQLGPDREVFKAVDALYTAVSLRDPRELDKCVKTLDDLRARDKLPGPVDRSLEGYIAAARRGKWEDAQRGLADFMRGQGR